MNKIQGLTENEEEFIIQTIQSFFPDAEILLFGSRRNHTYKDFSDVDICIKDKSPISLSKWSELEEIFAESELKVLVDLSDYHLLAGDFQKHILDTGFFLKTP